VYFIEILAHYNSSLALSLGVNNVNNLEINFMPKYFGITPQQRHIYFIMDVTNSYEI
jgi:hypothetical protein